MCIVVLMNGVVWYFYIDFDVFNWMDVKLFFVFDLFDIDEMLIFEI